MMFFGTFERKRIMDSTKLREEAAKIIGGWVDFADLAKKLLENSPFWLKVSGQFAGNQLEKRDDELILAVLNKAYEKAGEEYHGDLDAMLYAIVTKDLGVLRGTLTDRLVLALRTPLGDAVEGILVKNFLSTVFEISEFYITKDKIFPKDDSVGGGGPGGDPEPDEKD